MHLSCLRLSLNQPYILGKKIKGKEKKLIIFLYVSVVVFLCYTSKVATILLFNYLIEHSSFCRSAVGVFYNPYRQGGLLRRVLTFCREVVSVFIVIVKLYQILFILIVNACFVLVFKRAGNQVWFGLVWFYGILTILSYLLQNPFYKCIVNISDLQTRFDNIF